MKKLHLRRGISSTMRRDVEKNPLPALVKGEPGQLPTIKTIWWVPVEMGRSPDSKQTPVRVVGTKMSTGLLEAMVVSMDS